MSNPSDKELVETITNTVKDLVTALLWDDRKDDEDLPKGAIEAAVAAGLISTEMIVRIFKEELESYEL